MNVRPEFSHARFSTAILPRAEWRSAYCDLVQRRMVSDMDFEVTDERLSVDATVLKLPGVVVADTRTTAFRTTRTRAMAEGTSEYIFLLCLEGGAGFSHLGRVAEISTGEAILLSSAEPHVIERAMSHHFFITIPKTALAPMISDIDAALMAPMRCASDKFGLLSSYIGLLMKEPALAAPEFRQLAATHVQDLVAVAISATRDAAEITRGRSVRAARMRVIKADIAQHLASGEVTSEALAQRHRVSPRYIRKLFENEGMSLSQFVLGQRLLRVHRLLIDPRYADRTIGALAYDAGFGDLSTFNHAFRGHFGLTPSDVRAAARKQGPLAA